MSQITPPENPQIDQVQSFAGQPSPIPAQQASPAQPLSAQQAPSAQQAAPQPVAKSTSGLAIASLVLGILSLLTSFLPIINNGSFFIALLGCLLAIIGLFGIGRGKKSGLGIAIAGLVLGIVSVVIVLATQAFYSAALDEAFGTGSSTAPAATSESADDGVREAGSQPASEEGSARASAYDVSIDGAFTTTDRNGKGVIVVTYSWTNNSDKATSALVALYDKAFQNGVELERAYFIDDVDSSGLDSEVKPGYGTTFQRAYELADESDVTVEVTELISLNDTILAEATFSVQ